MSTPVVETISDPNRLADLGPEWDALAAESGLDHPFLTHDWVSAWWEAFGAGRELQILVVRDAGRAVAIAPLMRGRTRFCGLPLTSLETIGNDHTPRNGFLVLPGRDDAWQALWETLSRRGRGFALLLLRQLPAESPTLLAMKRLGAGSGWLEGRWPSLESPWLGPGGVEFNAYLNTLSSKYRAYLRNKERRAEKLGGAELETINAEDGLESALADGVRIEGSGWKGKEGTAIGSEAGTLQFYSLLARRAARRGWLRMHFLRIGERRVAFDYTLRYANRAYMLKAGYDSEYASISPSSLLVRAVLERAFSDKVEEFDFLGGLDGWKTCWTKTSRAHEWLYLLPPSLPLRVAHAAKFRLAPRLRQSPVYAAAMGAMRRRPPTSGGPGGVGRGSQSQAEQDAAPETV
jgi:CelD/BcsL family acetyltransferase involved in cellulose biosynthesis